MLKTKPILDPRENDDGIRISIMSKHTYNDGIKPHEGVTKDSFDVHGAEFAPPLDLIGDYYKRGLSWEKFEKRYINYLSSIYSEVMNLARMSVEKDVTLLCIEEIPEMCHRRLLAEECKKLKPKLEIIIIIK